MDRDRLNMTIPTIAKWVFVMLVVIFLVACNGNGLRYDPLGPDRDCGDFDTEAEAQAFFLPLEARIVTRIGLIETGTDALARHCPEVRPAHAAIGPRT